MNDNEKAEALKEDIENVIDRHGAENGVTYITVVGVLQAIVHERLCQADGFYDEQGVDDE